MSSHDDETVAFSRHAPVLLKLVALMVLVIPAWLYSISPDDPLPDDLLKEGDHAFSAGKQMVYFRETERRPHGYSDYCVLEDGQELVILQRPSGPSSRLIGKVVSTPTRTDPPFCPQAEILFQFH